jgi:hypothetical protein
MREGGLGTGVSPPCSMGVAGEALSALRRLAERLIQEIVGGMT